MYAKRVLLAGLGIYALALSTIVFSTDSIISWIIALALIGFLGLSIYYFYPQFIDIDDSKKKEEVPRNQLRTRLVNIFNT
jgi:hypothetical protein